jgi:hypothetical protein
MPNLNYAGDGRRNQRINRIERGDPLGNSSVSRGKTSFYGQESIAIEGSGSVDGKLSVDGLLTIDGVLAVDGNSAFTGRVIVTGPTDLDGDTDITGTTNITGPLHVTGDQDNTGKLAINGVTTLGNDLQVKTGGKITVEGAQNITLQSVAGTATLQFSDGPRMWSQSGAARMDAGPGASSVVTTAEAAILRSPDSSQAVAVSDTGTRIFGALYLPGLRTISGVSANVTIDPDTGELGVV